MKTVAVEDYLKAIFEIGREPERVSTTALAEHLKVAPASVTGMIKKLSAMRLITHKPYQGVELTPSGKKIALEVVRHHRLVERYLAEALGVPWDRVHEEAEKWEHVLSEDLEARMDAALGFPKVDPHGAPIPNRDGVIEEATRTRLSLLRPGDRAVVAEVEDHDSSLLRYVGDLGLFPGALIEILEIEPFNGSIQLRVGGKRKELGSGAAREIYVTQIETAEGEVVKTR